MSTGPARSRCAAGAPRAAGSAPARSASANARLSAASTAMRSRALTLPPSRIALISRSTSATASSSALLAAVGAAEEVALAEDRDFDLLHPTLRSGSPSASLAVAGGAGLGIARQPFRRTSIRLRAALSRERRLSRSLRHRGELRRAAARWFAAAPRVEKQALDPVGEFLDRGHDAPANAGWRNCRGRLRDHGAA